MKLVTFCIFVNFWYTQYARKMPERSYIKQNTTKRFSNSYNAEITTNKLDTVVDRYPKREQVTPNLKHYAKPWKTSLFVERRNEIVITRVRIGHSKITHSFTFFPDNLSYCSETAILLSQSNINSLAVQFIFHVEQRFCGRPITSKSCPAITKKLKGSIVSPRPPTCSNRFNRYRIRQSD